MFSNIVMIDYTRSLVERAKARKSVGPYRWTPTRPMQGRGFYQASKGLSVDPRGSTFDLRLDYANTHAPYQRRGAGPFTSPNDQEYTGVIARLPHGRGFLSGWTMGNGMCGSLDAYIWTDIEDAARDAINQARDAAEADYEEPEEDDDTL